MSTAKPQKLSVLEALLPIFAVMIFALLSVMYLKIGMIIPIIGSIIVAVLIGFYRGHTWAHLQEGLVQGVARALPALFIMLTVGAIIAAWIAGGVIPTIIYYSLELINPHIFIPATAFITAIIATATGTSFTSIATIGLALMGAGLSMGFPAPLLAGAIISGAYLGDSMSPLSDTTNLAAATSGSDLFDLLKQLVKTGTPAFVLSLVMFYVFGLQHVNSEAVELQEVTTILNGLQANFTITPWLFIIPLLTIAFSVKRFPALPSLVVIATLGALAAIFVQGFDTSTVLGAMTRGFKSETGIAMIDSLLTRGGIISMGEVIILLTSATALGGVLEQIGALDTILDAIMHKIHSNGGLIFTTAMSSIIVGFATGAQLLAIVLPSRMFLNEFKKRGVAPVTLGRIAQSIGCICINIVPWGVPATFATKILAVEPAQFIPYLFFPFLILILTVAFGYVGFGTVLLEESNEPSPTT